MRTLTTCIVLLSMAFYGYSQTGEEIPKATQQSVELLTAYLTEGCHSDRQKADSIYHWITHNIAYDYKLVQKTDPFGYQSPEETLKSKKAICNSYVDLFQDMLRVAGIHSEKVEGYVHRNEPGFYEVLFESSHVWIAVQLDEKWYLADPTWDAGYIGRIPKKEKTYPTSWTKERHFASEKKQQKWETKIRKKKEKFDQKMSERDPYTDKIGFVSDPSTQFYLMEPDTFLLTHMPVLPEWQLRHQTLSIEQFSSEDSVHQFIKAPDGPEVEPEILIDLFKEKNFVDQWLYTAVESQKFNHRNHGTAALNYYNTVGVFLDTKLGRMLKRYPKLQTQPLWDELIVISDSAIVAAKEALKTVKESKKTRTKYYKSSFKAESSAQKAIGKEAGKIEKIFEKVDKATATTNEYIAEEIPKINEKMAKYAPMVQNINPDAVKLESNDSDMMAIYTHFDSINKHIDSTIRALKYHREHSAQQGFLDALLYARWHVDYSNAFVSIYSMSTLDSVAFHDAMAVKSLEQAQKIYDDSLSHEVLPKDLSKSVKALESYVKGQRTRLQELEDNKQIDKASRIEKELSAIVNKRFQELLQLDLSSRAYHDYLMQNMRIIERAQDHLNNSWKHLERSREQRDEHLQKDLEIEYERLEKLYMKIQEEARKWKAELKTRLK